MTRLEDAIYLRKSRADLEAEAHGEGETLARHERVLLDLARARGLTIGQIYREIATADSIAARPQAQQLLRDVEARRWRAVLVVDTDRLARGDTIDQGIVARAFRNSETLIITPRKTYDPRNEMDEEYFEFELFMARREYKQIKRRMQAGRLASVKEGKYVGSRPPYGYRRIKLQGQKGWTLEPVPEEANIVRMMFDLYCNQGIGVTEIARRCEAMGARRMFGKPFDAIAIRKILRDPAYAGYVQWNQRVAVTPETVIDGIRHTHRPKAPDKHVIVKGLHEPLVSEELHKQACSLLTSHNRKPIRDDYTLQNPLAGLLYCARCGRVMTRKPGSPTNSTVVLNCPNAYCDQHGTLLSVVEQSVLDTLKSWVDNIDPADVPQIPTQTPSNAQTIQTLTHQMEALKRQQNKLYDLLEKEIYSEDVFIQRNALLVQSMSNVQTEIDRLSKPAELSDSDRIRIIIPRVASVLSNYSLTQPAQYRHELLASVISKIIYDKTSRCYRNSPPGANLSIRIIPKADI